MKNQEVLLVVEKVCENCHSHINYHLATNRDAKALTFSPMNSIERAREYPHMLAGQIAKAVVKCQCRECKADFGGMTLPNIYETVGGATYLN